jgi:hypothetical protein
METRRGARGKRRTAGSIAKAREVLRPPRRAQDDGEEHGNGNYARLKAAATNSTAAAKAGGLKTAATLRSRTAGSQDESGCSAIHKLNGEGDGARGVTHMSSWLEVLAASV